MSDMYECDLFAKNSSTFLKLFLVDFTLGETLFKDIEGRSTGCVRVMRGAMADSTEPAHQEHDNDHCDGDENDHRHDRPKNQPCQPPDHMYGP